MKLPEKVLGSGEQVPTETVAKAGDDRSRQIEFGVAIEVFNGVTNPVSVVFAAEIGPTPASMNQKPVTRFESIICEDRAW